VLEGHEKRLEIAGEFLSVLEDTEMVEDNMYEGLQISHSWVFREDFEPGAAKVLVARSVPAFFDVSRATNFDTARRIEHVEILLNDDIPDFTCV
jgi:hypothetical protein